MSEMSVLAFGAAVAGLVQGISGFAFAMVAMAIWVWGVDPKLAAVMAVFGGVTGQIISVIRVRRGWHLHLLWPFVLGSAIGIPLGNQVLASLDPNRFKLVLGSMLVVCCGAMLATSKLPKITHGGRVADAFVGLLGGVMAPLSGFSGLAPALWASAARLRRRTSTAPCSRTSTWWCWLGHLRRRNRDGPAASRRPSTTRRWPWLPARSSSPRSTARRSTPA